ncbi:MAG TPA: hypothetical protein ENN30_02010 [Candidatus Woesearchaeota archaeon]|nr:hypothetical protein [Candidatus Woesearchaeota archaeon]
MTKFRFFIFAGLFALAFINPALAQCTYNYENMTILLSKSQACYNDSLVAIISGFEGCEGKDLRIHWSESPSDAWNPYLCRDSNTEDNFAVCTFKVPEGNKPAVIYLSAVFFNDNINDGAKYNLITNERTIFGVCEDPDGNKVDCSYECGGPPVRKWVNVEPAALPMHFMFALKDTTTKLYEPTVWGYVDEYGRDCSGADSYSEMLISRSWYKWVIDYDSLVGVFSQKEYIPMYLGIDQQISEGISGGIAAELAEECSGDGKICYTAIPVCGDNICDVDVGERCWNCPSDCGGLADNPSEWDGTCGVDESGCTRCPVIDTTFADLRGCVIEYKDVGENCTCNEGMCDASKNLNCVFTEYDINTGELSTIYPGKCCYEGEYWYNGPTQADPSGPHCEKYRKVEIQQVTVDVKDAEGIDYGIFKASASDAIRQIWNDDIAAKNFVTPQDVIRTCCGTREPSETAWAQVNLKIKNYGTVDETLFLTVHFDRERYDYKSYSLIPETESSSSYGDFGSEFKFGGTSWTRSMMITIGAGEMETVTFDTFWCVLKEPGLCSGTIKCDSRQCTVSSGGNPGLHIDMYVRETEEGKCIIKDANNHKSCYIDRYGQTSPVTQLIDTYLLPKGDWSWDSVNCDLINRQCDTGRGGEPAASINVGVPVCGGGWNFWPTLEGGEWVKGKDRNWRYILPDVSTIAETTPLLLYEFVAKTVKHGMLLNCDIYDDYSACLLPADWGDDEGWFEENFEELTCTRR